MSETDFVFDDEVIEEEEPVKEEAPKYSWDGPAYVFDSYDEEFDEEEAVFVKFYKMLGDPEGRKKLLPLQAGKLVVKDIFSLRMYEKNWSKLPLSDTYQGWEKWMEEYTIGQLVRVASRMMTSSVYTSGPGNHANMYNGHGKYVVSANGETTWKLADKTFPYCIPVSSSMEATAMVAGACVAKEIKTTYTSTEGGAPEAVSTYSFADKTNSGKHPIALKRALKSFINFGNEAVTTKSLSTRPFIWEGMAREVAKQKLLTPDMTPISSYYYFVGQYINFPKSRLDPAAFAAITLPYDKYCTIMEHSWFCDGMYLRHPTFLTWAMENFFVGSAIGGEIPKNLPDWCRTKGAKFERDGASAGDPGLELSVVSVVDRSMFSGVVYNPSGEALEYDSCHAVILPLGKDYHTSGTGIQWAAEKPSARCALLMGVRPMLLISTGVNVDNWPLCSPGVLSRFYEMAPALAYYNMIVCASKTQHAGYPINPVILVTLDGSGKPVFTTAEPASLPLGRYLGNKESAKAKSAADLFSKYYVAATAKKRSAAGPRPSAKR